MTSATACYSVGESVQVPLHEVEHELSRQLQCLAEEDHGPVQRVRMSNLVVYCDTEELLQAIAAEIPKAVAVHPGRVILLVGEPTPGSEGITAFVRVQAHGLDLKHQACSEQVILRAGGDCIQRLPFAVRALAIGDLPTNLWWGTPTPPPFGGILLHELGEPAQQIIYDSLGWREPAKGVAATATWLDRVERTSGGKWRVASDLNWRRLKYWRRLVAQALDPNLVSSITEVNVEHGPHAVVQAWELISWIAQRLGWKVVTGKVQQGVQIGWRFHSPDRDVRVNIRRLEQGPPEIKQVQFSCSVNGQATKMTLAHDGELRLAIAFEGMATAPRTVTAPRLDLAELLGRQLSDRERDPAFRQSMEVAQVLARSVGG
jgi:glucose-6-phosphate dehydrogenase assembly protein OpcA